MESNKREKRYYYTIIFVYFRFENMDNIDSFEIKIFLNNKLFCYFLILSLRKEISLRI